MPRELCSIVGYDLERDSKAANNVAEDELFDAFFADTTYHFYFRPFGEVVKKNNH